MSVTRLSMVRAFCFLSVGPTPKQHDRLGPVNHGDNYNGAIHGGNVGGRNNRNIINYNQGGAPKSQNLGEWSRLP
jgi:hypothetical protein